MTTAAVRRLRDTITAAFLFVASAAFTFWQNAHVAVLWDISYLLDSSYRISLRQVPYRDFPFAHAPLTFLLHAALIHLFGRSYLPHILCATLEAGAATVLTWRILLRLLPGNSWLCATLLAVPLTVLGIYAIYPHPIYDSDSILAVLVAIFLLQVAEAHPILNFLAGVACIPPLFFKQNIGLFFLAVVLLSVFVITVLRRSRRLTITPQIWFLFGATSAFIAALLAIHYAFGLHNYFYWTITFAAQRRLPGIRIILETYLQPSLLWTVPAAIAGFVLLRTQRLRRRPWILPIAFLLFAAPFLWTIANLAVTTDRSDRADQLLSLWPHLLLLSTALALFLLVSRELCTRPRIVLLLPVILLATIHGAFLSQQLWGSTYAIWPLLILLTAGLLNYVPPLARPLSVTISVTLLLCGSLYAISHERLSYIHLEGYSAEAHLPQLHGMVASGPYIPDFEQLVQVTNEEIPAHDGILLLPGDVPFYFATGRVPQFPILLFDPATDPYTPQQIRDQARMHNIRWLIVTRNLQLTESPKPDLPQILQSLQKDFIPYRSVANYDIYRRR